MDTFLNIFLPVLIFLSGLCIGSFLNVLAYRIPNELNPSEGRSKCPKCGHELKAWELVPVFSYILLRGKCSKCKRKISLIYPIIELVTAALYLALYLVFGISYTFFLYLIVITMMIVIIVIDYQHKYIPDRFNFGIIALALVNALVVGFSDLNLMLNHFIGLFVGFALVLIVRTIGQVFFKKEAMGFGDVKLLAGIGFLLGWKAAIFTFFVGCILASLIELSLMYTKLKAKDSEIAFGPYLIYAAIIYMFVGETLINLYLQLIGG